MAKVWKKLQRADGDFQGTWDGVAKGNVYHTANKPTKSDVGLSNVTNHAAYHSGNKPTKSDVGLGNVANESPTTLKTTMSLNNASLWDADNKRIINVANPTGDQDAATKHYLENTWWKDQSQNFHFDNGADLRYALNVDKAGHFIGGLIVGLSLIHI